MTDEQQKEMETLLWELHKAVLEASLRRITGPNATGSDLANAVKFLRDNRITIDEVEDDKIGYQGWSGNPNDLPFPSKEGD